MKTEGSTPEPVKEETPAAVEETPAAVEAPVEEVKAEEVKSEESAPEPVKEETPAAVEEALAPAATEETPVCEFHGSLIVRVAIVFSST